jgi:Tol biopolymer transport system component
MTLAVGTRLGPYEILAPIGAGGMGEVYKARDTRLERTVAVKVLPENLTSPEVRQRFEREAKTISQLSHPHICALHDVGREGDLEYLVMEYLEGETLADRLTRGALPFEQVCRYGVEIAQALGAAHAAGVVHRDLKPGNVMLTKTGVKLLDFGLAKALGRAAPVDTLTSAPTRAKDLTTQGTILGTIPYMAPEQLEGREADARTDIFALGSVLYEMAVGRKAFTGSSQASLIASILTSEPPPVSSLQPLSPPAFDRLVKTCLDKDPAERWQSAHDISLQLRSIGDKASLPQSAVTGAPKSRGAAWVPWAVAVVLAAIAAAALLRPRAVGPAAAVVRFGLPPPDHGAFGYSVAGRFIAVSPDGSRIGYIATDAQAPQPEYRIWVRRLSALEAQPIPGTEGASSLFWSPDSRSIGFFAGTKLKRVDLSGGATVPICDVPTGGDKSGTWGRGGDILFAGVQSQAVYRVSSSGGEPVEVVRADPSHGELRTVWPWFLPDGERFLYLVRAQGSTGKLMLAEPGKKPRALMPMVSDVAYCDPGFLVFSREGILLARRFDWKTGRVSGEPFPIAERVRYFLATFALAFGLSRNGLLVYQDRDEEGRLVWVDRTGREVGTVGPLGGYRAFSIAPDGRRVFSGRTWPGIATTDIWSFDLERGVETRITSEVGDETAPLALQDGRIAYSVGRGGSPVLHIRDLATGKEEPFSPKERSWQQAQDVSPDGRTLVYTERDEQGSFEAWVGSLSGPAKPALLLKSSALIGQLRFSPDGRFVAFVSAESGRSEAYVMPYPGPGEKTRVSTAGARLLRWSPDGRELLYLSPDRRMVSVPIRTAPALQIGSPTELFVLKGREWRRVFNDSYSSFSVSPDGKRFLVMIPEVVADEFPLTVAVDWTAEASPK